MKWFENFLRHEIGLDAASVGSSLIERTVRLRMKALGLTTPEDYRDQLVGSPAEREEFIEGVVVTETWFFRDLEPFPALVELVQQSLAAPISPGVVRILSLPCSTGEEPFSLAMALLDADVPRSRFAIDAVDLSARTLARAQLGVYGKNSFRGRALAFRDRHFAPAGEGWQLDGYVRDCAQFHRGNLLAEDFFADRAPYDVIFCRNLLIYFDRATQARALRKLDALLAPQGVLFVGPAEMPLVAERGFVSAGLPMAFACRKAWKENRATRRRASHRPVNGTLPAAALVRVPPFPSRSNLIPTAIVPDHAPAKRDLQVAGALADAGKLTEAAAICEAHLQADGPSAQAYYLLGLVRDASGDPAALDYYRKALYLEPNHQETLLQMSLLLAKLGDTRGARALKHRAERQQSKAAA